MSRKRKIVIWDTNARRASEISRNFGLAMQRTGIHHDLEIMSEPPLVARMGLSGRLPVLEVDGMLWNWKIGEGISEEAAVKLLYLLEKNVDADTGNKENGA